MGHVRHASWGVFAPGLRHGFGEARGRRARMEGVKHWFQSVMVGQIPV